MAGRQELSCNTQEFVRSDLPTTEETINSDPAHQYWSKRPGDEHFCSIMVFRRPIEMPSHKFLLIHIQYCNEYYPSYQYLNEAS